MRTNVMDLKLDAAKASEHWKVLEMTEPEPAGGWMSGSPLIDALVDSPVPIAGVVFCASPRKRVLVAVPVADDFEKLLAYVRSLIPDSSCRPLSWIGLYESSLRDCLRLLWVIVANKLGGKGKVACQNVTGKFFVNVSQRKCWIERYVGNDKKSKDPHAEAVFLEVCIDEDCEFSLAVRSFTKRKLLLKECDSLNWNNLKAEARRRRIVSCLQGFRISSARILSSARGQEDGDVYVLRKLMAVNSKNEVDWGAYIVDDWSGTKVGVIKELMAYFKVVHGDYAQISFKELDESGRIKTYKPTKKELSCKEPSLPDVGGPMAWREDELPIRIVAAEGCEELRAEIEGYLAKVGIAVSESEGRLSLCCIPAKDFVSKESDPYAKMVQYPAQHVTAEILVSRSYKKKKGLERTLENMVSWPGLETSLKELRIKGDIEAGRIRLYDWSRIGIDETLAFAMVVEKGEDGEPSSFAVLEISPDGSMLFAHMDSFYDGDDEFVDQSVRALDEEPEGTWCCVSPSLGTVVGTETKMVTMPSFTAMADYAAEFKQGKADAGQRSAETLMALYGDEFDIAWAVEPGGMSALYYAADCHNARTKRARATRLRRLTSFDGPIEPWLDILMTMLDVWFVKMREGTVRPFPIKYLREWCDYMRAWCPLEDPSAADMSDMGFWNCSTTK